MAGRHPVADDRGVQDAPSLTRANPGHKRVARVSDVFMATLKIRRYFLPAFDIDRVTALRSAGGLGEGRGFADDLERRLIQLG